MATLANMVFRVLLCNWLIAALAFGATAAPAGQPLRIVVLGDSLVAGLGIKPSEAFPAQLERALKERGHAVEVINAGVSGDTTAGGLDRVGWAVPERTGAVILELGANDALRGLPVSEARENLARMVRLSQAAGARVLLVGMRIPPNYGPRYTEQFARVFPELATQYHLPLVPFLLDKVALDPTRMQPDGMHPNARGEPPVLDTLWPYLKPLLKKNPQSGGR